MTMKKRNFTVMAFRAGLNPAARAAFDEIDSPDRRRMAKAIAFDRPLFKINRNAEKKSV